MKWNKQKHPMLQEFEKININIDKFLFDKLKLEIPTIKISI